MNKISIYLATGLMVTSGLLGAAVGYSFSPEYRTSMYEKGTMGLGRADKSLDKRYIDAMAAHHRGAMLLAEQAAQGAKRQEIKSLSKDILAGEPKLIAELYSWKRAWYGDAREAQDPVVANLGPSDEKFDLRFLNALISHHEAGIEMTQEARTKSSRAEVLDNADAVEAFLKTTLETFKSWRLEWYNV
ncbi:MAG: DUF305 domain-containing protein [Candidatus Taylorbacteria bacterium]|nr:DUF305 domain-containing protein [Candidatus Taylorbacteria bacterium]